MNDRRIPAGLSWALILVLFLADQLTKLLVLRFIPFEESLPVFPGFFCLTHVYNTGAAFSMFHGNNAPFIVLSLGVLAGLILLRPRFGGWLLGTGWILLISGILGNVTDRILRGHVIDFLDFQFGSYHWPAFNVADSCICVAAGLFLLSGFTTPDKPSAS